MKDDASFVFARGSRRHEEIRRSVSRCALARSSSDEPMNCRPGAHPDARDPTRRTSQKMLGEVENGDFKELLKPFPAERTASVP